MKSTRTPRLVFVSTLALAALHPARAQTIDYVLVKKQQTHTQLTATLTSAPPSSAVFSASVLGSNLSGITTPSLTSLPDGSTGSTGPLTYNATDDEWRFQQTFANGGVLETSYGAGDFGLTVQGQALTVGLPNETRFTAAPKVTVSGSTPNFVNGVLTWNVSQPLTLTLSDPGGTGVAAIDHMSLSVFGTGVDSSDQHFGNGTITLSFPAFAFTSGQSYFVDMAFSNIAGGSALSTVSGGALNGVQYGGIYEKYTSFTISAIPEPSTYAAMAGLGALALAIWRRRRTSA